LNNEEDIRKMKIDTNVDVCGERERERERERKVAR
jgi:hypothetical protein